MTAFALIVALTMTTLIAALLFSMPSIVRPTLPLGVAIPGDRVADPVVGRAVRRFRGSVAASWVLCVVLSLVLAFIVPALAVLVSTLGIVILGTVAYLACRSAILRAKRDGDWYQGARVRISADITASPSVHPPTGWLIAALLVLLVTLAIGVAVFPTLPDRIPVHWGASGEADRYADKTVWSVFGPLVIGIAVALFLYLLAFVTRAAPLRSSASGGTPQEKEQRAARQRVLAGSLLGQLLFVVSLCLSWLAVAGWAPELGSAAVLGGVLAMVVLILIVVVRFVLGQRSPRRSPVAAGAASGGSHPTETDAPDDDRYWKAGIFYVNSDDPAIMVPKRFGVGWTINLGSPGGLGILAVLVLVLVGVLAMSAIDASAG